MTDASLDEEIVMQEPKIEEFKDEEMIEEPNIRK